MRPLCLAVLLAASAAAAQTTPSPTGEEPRTLFSIAIPRPGDGPVSGYDRLCDAEATYRGSEWWDAYVQIRAQAAAPLGLHAEALRWWDARRGDAPEAVPPAEAPPDGAHAVDAAEWIAEHAEQVVLVNEAHHDASSRLLTLRLLPLLYERGFRYLAAEAFAPDSVLAGQPGYPTPEMGTYLGDPVFGAVVREALRLGYTLVPYEIENNERGGGDPQARRDSMQAVHLADRIFSRDPTARVLVHAGFSHVYETADEGWHPMAAYFREITGIDPLSVDQTERGEGSMAAFESAAYRGALPLLGDAPAIILDAHDALLRLGVDAPVDVVVIRPRTVYADGRPMWMTLGGRLVARSIQLPEACAKTVCVTEVRRRDEPGSTPLDRAVVENGLKATLYLPAGDVEITTLDGRTGRSFP